MDERIRNFIESHYLGVVGVSRSRTKFGAIAYRTLKKKGYHLYPLNPALENVAGDKCYRDVSELPVEVEALLMTVAPDKAEVVVDRLEGSRIKKIWFQQGADFSKAAEKARAKGIETVTDRCILMYAPPVRGIHSFHRLILKLFGKL
ncbi:MAG: CoA-binding protein [Candidatus Zixiibacteriota bacterium]